MRLCWRCCEDGVCVCVDDVVWMAWCKWCCVDGAPSAAPATQNEAAPKRLKCRQASADLSRSATSAAPALQNAADVLQVLHLPRKRD